MNFLFFNSSTYCLAPNLYLIGDQPSQLDFHLLTQDHQYQIFSMVRQVNNWKPTETIIARSDSLVYTCDHGIIKSGTADLPVSQHFEAVDNLAEISQAILVEVTDLMLAKKTISRPEYSDRARRVLRDLIDTIQIRLYRLSLTSYIHILTIRQLSSYRLTAQQNQHLDKLVRVTQMMNNSINLETLSEGLIYAYYDNVLRITQLLSKVTVPELISRAMVDCVMGTIIDRLYVRLILQWTEMLPKLMSAECLVQFDVREMIDYRLVVETICGFEPNGLIINQVANTLHQSLSEQMGCCPTIKLGRVADPRGPTPLLHHLDRRGIIRKQLVDHYQPIAFHLNRLIKGSPETEIVLVNVDCERIFGELDLEVSYELIGLTDRLLKEWDQLLIKGLLLF